MTLCAAVAPSLAPHMNVDSRTRHPQRPKIFKVRPAPTHSPDSTQHISIAVPLLKSSFQEGVLSGLRVNEWACVKENGRGDFLHLPENQD